MKITLILLGVGKKKSIWSDKKQSTKTAGDS